MNIKLTSLLEALGGAYSVLGSGAVDNVTYCDIAYILPTSNAPAAGCCVVFSPETEALAEGDFIELVRRLDSFSSPICLIPGGFAHEDFFRTRGSAVAVSGCGEKADFSSLVLSRAADLMRRYFDSYVSVSENFAQMSLNNEDIAPMVFYFEAVIGNPVAVYDEAFRCVVSTNPSLELLGKLNTRAKMTHLSSCLYFLRQKILLSPDGGHSTKSTLVSFPISFRGKICAYLSVLEINRAISEADYVMLEVAASAILTKIKHNCAIESLETNNINRLFSELVLEHPSENLLAAAKANGLRENGRFIIAVTDADAESPTIIRPRPLSGILRADIGDELLAIAGRLTERPGEKSLTGILRGSIITVFALGDDEDEKSVIEEIKTCCARLDVEIANTYKKSALKTGIGKCVRSISGLAQAYRTAQSALNYGKIIYSGKRCGLTVFEDNMMLRLISSVNSREALDDLICDKVRKLREYDAEHSSDMLLTLEVYLDCNGNAKEASERMFIHHKTMIYRLKKLSSLFDIDLSDCEQRLALSLGIRVSRMLEKQ